MRPLRELEAWFVTGSQHLYGEAVLRKVDENARHIARCLDEAASVPVRVVPKPVVTTPDAIGAVLREADASPTCIVIAWMHTFSPAKMWIGGLTDLRKPLVHLHTQYNRDLPWADIDMDFMNLNQAAHGDREFAFIQTRAPAGPEDDRWLLGGPGGDGAAGMVVAGGRRLARGTPAQGRPVRRQHAPGRGHRGRQGRGAGAARFSVNGYGVNDLVDRVASIDDTAVDDLVDEYEAAYDVAMPLRRNGGRRHAELRAAARIEAGLRSFVDEGGFGHSPTRSRTSAGSSSARHRRPADGRRYGFGAEGDWKAAALVRILKVMAEGLPGGTSFMEDYTYHLGDPVPEVLGAHARGLPVADDRQAVVRDPPALDRGPVRSRPPGLRRGTGPAVILGLADLGDRFRLIASEVDVEADAPLPNLPVARAVWRPRPSLATAAEAWLTAGGPHHTALTSSLGIEPLVDFADIADLELVTIDAGTTSYAFKRELRWNQAYYFVNRGP